MGSRSSGPPTVIPNSVLRERFERMVSQGVSKSEIAKRCGHFTTNGQGYSRGDTSWLKRKLGYYPNIKTYKGKTYYVYQERVTEPVAKKLCKALDLNPSEVGL